MRLWIAGLVTQLSIGAAFAAPVVVSRSEVKATFKQLGSPVTGVFKAWSADVDFDAAQPSKTRANIVINTASYDLGDPMYNKEVAGKDWFDSKVFPQATFVLSQVKQAPDGRLSAVGELTVRGQRKMLEFPVQVSQQGNEVIFQGKALIQRLDFKIGSDGEWADTSLLDNGVVVQFKLVQIKK